VDVPGGRVYKESNFTESGRIFTLDMVSRLNGSFFFALILIKTSHFCNNKKRIFNFTQEKIEGTFPRKNLTGKSEVQLKFSNVGILLETT
jgi:hypothetical protein